MKVLLLNGSSHQQGCTWRALDEVARTLEGEGISTELMWIGTEPIYGCTGCGACGTTGKCIYEKDPVNTIIEKMESCQGLIVGSPVYYASPNGALLSVLDRVFYAGGRVLRYKPGAAVVSARRAGTTASLDVLNKYFLFGNMPLVASSYWPMVHGALNQKDQVEEDKEGLQIMRNLGRNMAWLLHSIQAGEEKGITLPKPEEKTLRTNFIR